MMESMLSNVPALYVIGYPLISMLCAQAFADMSGGRSFDHDALKTGGYVRLQLVDGDQLGAVFIGSGEVGNEVVNCFNAKLGQKLRPGGANAGEGCYG